MDSRFPIKSVAADTKAASNSSEPVRRRYMTEIPEQNRYKSRIIVSDDERLIANTLAIILNNAGYEARAVFSGEHVVDLLESFQPQLLITDVVMPGISGIEAAIVTRNKLPTCNILLF